MRCSRSSPKALVEAEDQGCETVTAFATSAVREATNSDEVVALVLAPDRRRPEGAHR